MLTFFPSQPALEAQETISIIGLGGTGTHIVNKLKSCAPQGLKLVTMNSGAQLASESLADINLSLGSSITRGLSCGGDPDLGRRAAESSLEELEGHIDASRLVFLTVGLGGGTGSGAAPVIAKKIRESGAFLVVFATLPFSFEGSRRLNQAKEALSELSLYTNILLTFENDRMGELIASEKGVQEAFAAANTMVAESIASLSRISLKPGLINLGLADIAAVLGNNLGKCLFGFGSASGPGRGKNALLHALACPLLSQRDALANSPDVLVHLSGSHDLTLAEIESVMRELATHLSQDVNIHFGVSIDEKMDNSLSLIILAGVPNAFPNRKREDVVIIDDPHLGEPDEEEETDFAVMEPDPVPTPSPAPPGAPVSSPTQTSAPASRRPIIEEELPLPIPGEIGDEIREAMAAERNGQPLPAREAPVPSSLFEPEPVRRISEQQSELEFSRSVKGKFAGEQADLIDGEDLDLPPALRKKKQM